MTGGRLVIDTSKCIACRACQVACKQWHSLPSEDTAFTGSYQNPPDMSGANLTVAKFTEIEDPVTLKMKWLFFKDQCRHCEGAFCSGACPRAAIIKMGSGFVRIDPVICDPNLCSAADTKPCQNACPFNIPKYKYEKGGSTVATKMKKCDLCYNRLKDPLLKGDSDPVPPNNVKYKGSNRPSCMLTCPSGAMSIGLADAMWTAAVSRVKQLRAMGFSKATIYPRQSGAPWGPTRVIWILTESSSVYGLPGYGY